MKRPLGSFLLLLMLGVLFTGCARIDRETAAGKKIRRIRSRSDCALIPLLLKDGRGTGIFLYPWQRSLEQR